MPPKRKNLARDEADGADSPTQSKKPRADQLFDADVESQVGELLKKFHNHSLFHYPCRPFQFSAHWLAEALITHWERQRRTASTASKH